MSTPLHFAFFGPSLVSTSWNGAVTYHRGILHALAERGHRVTFFEPGGDDRRHRDLPDPERTELVVYPATSRWTVLNAVEQARGADVVVKCSGVGLYDDVLEAGVLELKSPRTLAVYRDVDAPATVDRLTHNFSDPFRSLLRRFDLVAWVGPVEGKDRNAFNGRPTATLISIAKAWRGTATRRPPAFSRRREPARAS